MSTATIPTKKPASRPPASGAVEPTAVSVSRNYRMPPTEVYQEVIIWTDPDMNECFPGYVCQVFDKEITVCIRHPGGGEEFRYSVVHKDDPRIPYFDKRVRWRNPSGLWDYAPQVHERRKIVDDLAALNTLCETLSRRIADLEKRLGPTESRKG